MVFKAKWLISMVGIRFWGSRDEILTFMQRLGVIIPPYSEQLKSLFLAVVAMILNFDTVTWELQGCNICQIFFIAKKSSWTFCVSPVHYSYRHGRHGGGHTAVWGGTFDRWYYALLSRVKQMSQLCFVCGSNHPIRPTNHIRIRLKWAPFKQKFWLRCHPSNFWDLSQINLIYAQLTRIQLYRDYTLFKRHFWPNLVTGGTKTF